MDDRTRQRLIPLLTAGQALRSSMEASLRADTDNVWKYAAFRQYARKFSELAQAVANAGFMNPLVKIYDADKMSGPLDTIALQQKEIFETIHANLSILIATLEVALDTTKTRIQGLRDFLASSVRRAVLRAPEREADIQDVVEQLFIGRGMQRGSDYDRETGRVKVSIKEVVPDFILPKLGLALEVKLTKHEQRAKEVVDEINADIRAYSQRYQAILFLVYDLGTIRDETEFRQGLEQVGSVEVLVVKH